jgi:hypothetical protein
MSAEPEGQALDAIGKAAAKSPLLAPIVPPPSSGAEKETDVRNDNHAAPAATPVSATTTPGEKLHHISPAQAVQAAYIAALQLSPVHQVEFLRLLKQAVQNASSEGAKAQKGCANEKMQKTAANPLQLTVRPKRSDPATVAKDLTASKRNVLVEHCTVHKPFLAPVSQSAPFKAKGTPSRPALASPRRMPAEPESQPLLAIGEAAAEPPPLVPSAPIAPPPSAGAKAQKGCANENSKINGIAATELASTRFSETGKVKSAQRHALFCSDARKVSKIVKKIAKKVIKKVVKGDAKKIAKMLTKHVLTSGKNRKRTRDDDMHDFKKIKRERQLEELAMGFDKLNDTFIAIGDFADKLAQSMAQEVQMVDLKHESENDFFLSDSWAPLRPS